MGRFGDLRGYAIAGAVGIAPWVLLFFFGIVASYLWGIAFGLAAAVFYKRWARESYEAARRKGRTGFFLSLRFLEITFLAFGVTFALLNLLWWLSG